MPPSIKPSLAFDDVLLVPQKTALQSRSEADLRTTVVPGVLDLAIPLLSANTPWCTEERMAIALARLGGLGVIHRMQTVDAQSAMVAAVRDADPTDRPDVTRTPNGRLAVGAAVGVNGRYLERVRAVVDAGATAVVVDIAHGHSTQMVSAIDRIKETFPELPVIAGNVATTDGYLDLADAGADAVKVGIGPGSICTTRQVAGAGVPQLSAVMDCAEAALNSGVPIIADGGLRTSGDIVKALAGGASAVMLGSMLAGVSESAALLVEQDGTKFKTTTGFVTLGTRLTIQRAEGRPVSAEELAEYVPEGVEATFPYQGNLRDVLKQYCGGIRSGFSYSGAKDIKQLWRKAQFVQVSSAGQSESQAHALERSPQVHPDYKRYFLNHG